jgi:hypothetical protein
VPSDSFWTRFTKVATSIFKEEVKTPLSFYFRVAILIPVVLGAILLVSEAPSFKLQVLRMSFGFLFLLCMLVGAFAWFRPKHLVYGEAGHRAELKLEYGTDQHTLTHREAIALEGIQAPKQIEAGDNLL